MITVLIWIELIMAQCDAMTIYMAQFVQIFDKLIIATQCTFFGHRLVYSSYYVLYFVSIKN